MSEDKKGLVERLFAEQRGVLHAFLLRRVRRHPDAADLAQEVYLRMLRVPDIHSIQSPESYLFTVASNLTKEYARRGHAERNAIDFEDPQVQECLAELPTAATEMDRDLRIERLREVLHQLPAKCRATVVLAYWHRQSYQQIAAQLDISTHMVKKYLSQALVHCRRRMASLG